MFQPEQQVRSRRAMNLFLRTQVAFANCEANGLKIDIPYLNQAIIDTQANINKLEEKIKSTEVWDRWQLIHGSTASLTSRQQLGIVLFKNIQNAHKYNMGFECEVLTDKKQPNTSDSTLERIAGLEEFAKDYGLYMSLNKVLVTYLKGIRKALDPNDFIHPSFSLFSVISYRTSSSNPNFQNFPKRNELLGELVRRCFIPREPNRHIVEIDYSGAEVRVNASINRDPTLVGSITEGTDFHKKVASMAYLLPESDVTKPLRQSVKGPFTFAAFYGSYWLKIARDLWNIIVYGGLKLNDGTPLLDHVKSRGIAGLGDENNPLPGSYFYHIREVEKEFWGVLFKKYAEWKDKAWEAYQKVQYVDTPSGFRCAGVFSKNVVTNIPAQAGAAHCLLWSFVELDQRIKEMGFGACICGQIHDSIVLDVPHDELDDVIRQAEEIMTVKLPEYFKWIEVPMEVEADVAPMGKSWWEAKGYSIPK